MAIDPATPEPLKAALEGMEASLRSTMNSFQFAAPEMQPLLWGALHQQLTEYMTQLYDMMGEMSTTTITPREQTQLYQHVAKTLIASGEVAGEGFILRLAEITADAVLEKLSIEVSP